jgi:hypothetical protein
MSNSYRTRKKKLSRDQRRQLGDAQDAVSPKIIQQRERADERAERFQAKLVKHNAEIKEADEAIEKAKADSIVEEVEEVKKEATKKKLSKKTTDKKATAKKTTKKVAKKATKKKDE